MKKQKFSSAQTVLILIAAFVAILTWLVPAGKYDTLTYNKSDNTFCISGLDGTKTIEASQTTLVEFQIKIPFEKFNSGAIWKPIAIPNTYK